MNVNVKETVAIRKAMYKRTSVEIDSRFGAFSVRSLICIMQCYNTGVLKGNNSE